MFVPYLLAPDRVLPRFHVKLSRASGEVCIFPEKKGGRGEEKTKHMSREFKSRMFARHKRLILQDPIVYVSFCATEVSNCFVHVADDSFPEFADQTFLRRS